MRFPFWQLLLATALSPAQPQELQTVEVIVPGIQPPMETALFNAQTIATRIFSQIGVRLRWRRWEDNDGCTRNPLRIVISLSARTPAAYHPGALAIAHPFAAGVPCVTVFADRLRPMLAENPGITSSLFGHVLAHEISHILRGTDSHSESGVLKSAWSKTEIRGMPARPLAFTGDDSRLIREAIREASPPISFQQSPSSPRPHP